MAILAISATVAGVKVYIPHPLAGNPPRAWVVIGTVSALMSWVGAWGWWRGRWAIAAVGTAFCAWANLWLSVFALVPLAILALVAAGLAVLRRMERRDAARAGG
ncbi:MAG: hypothetical protein WDA27_04290 [Actinomycetota bacterium]